MGRQTCKKPTVLSSFTVLMDKQTEEETYRPLWFHSPDGQTDRQRKPIVLSGFTCKEPMREVSSTYTEI